MFKDFKEFAFKGNVVDLAVGVIIGGAFQKIVTSLVNDIIMPAISIVTGKVDYSDLVFKVGDVSITYGSFLTTVIDFLIVAFSLFLIIKYINKLNKKLEEAKLNEVGKLSGLNEKLTNNKIFKKKEEPQPAPTTKICPYCVSEISIKATRCPHCTSVLTESTLTENVEDENEVLSNETNNE